MIFQASKIDFVAFFLITFSSFSFTIILGLCLCYPNFNETKCKFLLYWSRFSFFLFSSSSTLYSIIWYLEVKGINSLSKRIKNIAAILEGVATISLIEGYVKGEECGRLTSLVFCYLFIIGIGFLLILLLLFAYLIVKFSSSNGPLSAFSRNEFINYQAV